LRRQLRRQRGGRSKLFRARPFEGTQACSQRAIGPGHDQRVNRHVAPFLARDELEALSQERPYQATVTSWRVARVGPGWQPLHGGGNVEAIARRPGRPPEDLKRLELIRELDELLQCDLGRLKAIWQELHAATRSDSWTGRRVLPDRGDFESLRRFRNLSQRRDDWKAKHDHRERQLPLHNSHVGALLVPKRDHWLHRRCP
jgi:hypothetical protein